MPASKKRSTRLVDMTGQTIGRLTVVQKVPAPSHYVNRGRAYWECVCDCGNTAIVQGRSLRAGVTNSCGCLRIELFEHTVTKHGQARMGAHTRTYESWQAMRRRCLNEKETHYERYGGRGITICDRWNSFEAFLEDMGERPAGKTLDRYPNNDGNYEPGNCRWATHKEQQANRSISLVYEFDGRRMSLTDWAKEVGVSYPTLRTRIQKYGWSIERALTTPRIWQPDRNESWKEIEIDGVTRNASEWARIWGLPPHTVWKRLRLGWSVDLLPAPIGTIRRRNAKSNMEKSNARV